ncbi:hypothetical protein [Streptomyces sp. S186]|uniref:hypothetical protein n=1 Tax=Streptomyces sp. S186 TaxID=3434395 RepID=UPI003F67B986
MDDDQRILDLFHALDQLPGPEHLEFPHGFDYARAGTQAARLAERLSRELARPCVLDGPMQDASYSFMVRIPAAATEAGVPLGIRLSNFGHLAVVTTPAPDGHDDLDQAMKGGALSATDRWRIDSALSDLGYLLVPQQLLHRLYDGRTWLADDVGEAISYGEHRGRATWWTRFFDHL